jgi:hypothetical protein
MGDNATRCACDYEETYYGWKCKKCGDFIPFGCAPWEDWDEPEEYVDDGI